MIGRRNRAALFLGIGAAVAVVLIVVVVAFLPRSSGSPSCFASPPSYLPGAQTDDLIPCHTTVPLAAHSYMSYSLPRESDTETAVGQYTVSESPNGSVEGFMLNASELNALSTNPHPTSPPVNPPWSSGFVRVSNISLAVPPSPGQYFLVIENLGGAPASVQWSQSLVLYYVVR